MPDLIDFATFERSSKPNNYLVAPDGLCQNASPDASAPIFPADPGALFQNLKSLIDNDPQYRDLQADDSAMHLSAVAVTKVLKFKDDVDIAVLPAEGGATLAIYSRSRIGHSDFGKNRKRVEALIADLHEDRKLAEGRVA